VEIHDLRQVVERDLKDAAITALSDDRRFATAYNAALQSSKMAIACCGYRVVGQSHHQTTFEALMLAVGTGVKSLATYLETCRRKRNIVDYDAASIVSTTEADELLAKATELSKIVEEWIEKTHPALKR
jgi:hypothetical protein